MDDNICELGPVAVWLTKIESGVNLRLNGIELESGLPLTVVIEGMSSEKSSSCQFVSEKALVMTLSIERVL